MFEIFIPTSIQKTFQIHEIKPDFMNLIVSHFNVEITPFQSTFIEGIHIIGNRDFQSLCIACNGTFGSEHFIDYDWTNSQIVTLGQRFFLPDTIGEKLQNIVSDFESIVQTLGSDNLLTLSKKEEIRNKIRRSFFLLSGIVFNISELLRKTRENMRELELLSENPEQKMEYQGNGSLLLETLKTRELELSSGLSALEQKVGYFIDATKHFITT